MRNEPERAARLIEIATPRPERYSNSPSTMESRGTKRAVEDEAVRCLRRRCEAPPSRPKRAHDDDPASSSKRRPPPRQESGFAEGFAAGVAEERARLLAIGEATLREALQLLDALYAEEFQRFNWAVRSAMSPVSSAASAWGC